MLIFGIVVFVILFIWDVLLLREFVRAKQNEGAYFVALMFLSLVLCYVGLTLHYKFN